MRILPSVRITSARGRNALTPSARAAVAGRSTARAGAALGAVAAIALAGCAVARPAGQTAGSTGTTVTSTRSNPRPAAGPKQRAVADADAILASFAVPSGARKLAASPSADKGALKTASQVTWQPAVPPSEKVPAAAKAVTISMDLGLNQGGKKPPKPVTITDPAKVDGLKAIINSLPLSPPGIFGCPAGFGDNLVLTFRARPGAPALAVATDMLSGCEGVDLTLGGKSQPELASVSGTRILGIAGLPWKIPTL